MIELDDTDRRILNMLQRDCALTNQELAERVHVSAPTCLRRVRRLVEQGVIERQIAIVSPGAFGAGLTAIVEVTLERQSAELLQQFEQQLSEEPAVQQCYRVSAGPDFVLVVYVADMAAYHSFAHRALSAHANVRNVRSFFSVHRSKFAPAIPA
ncbi:MAG TPA: Lrp/AsnC family transcriptional regulator [Burkholderiaceae bacterium]|jgi:Lrp/AsnC family leucine-responsive transcriptional regulator|nr:Lrp/AsnC family transcriptional regulator [Burkholderiaceae bacterium]